MSRDAIEAEITLDENSLVPGERATLRFRMNARESVRVRGAHVSFAGFEETKAVYTSSNGKTTTTHTATERNSLVEAKKTFKGQAPAGFFHNLADGAKTLLGGGEHEELPRGSHDVVLEVDLPADLPESFKAKKIRVAYEASIHLDIPAGRDFRQTVAFDGPSAARDETPELHALTIRYPEDSGRGFFDSVFGPDVSMRVNLNTTVIARGGRLSGELEVRFKDKPPTIKAVVCALIRREKSEARGHRDGHSETLVSERLPQRESTSNSLFVAFEVRVPDEMIADRSGAKFTLSHELAVSLDVPWAKDPTIRIPVVVV